MLESITKAKATLIIEQPFFASLLLGMPMHETTSIPTFGTDGKMILYNPKYAATLKEQEVVFVLAHEVMHCALMHMFRFGARDKQKANIAADFVVNDILVNEKVGTINANWLYDPKIVKAGGGTMEGVYDLLPDPPKDGCAGDKGMAQDEVMCSPGDAASKEQDAAEMRVKIVQAANAAKMAGKLSANMQRLVGELVRSTVDWKSVLRRFLTEKAKIDWSYARPKRRFLSEDIFMPSLQGEQLGEIIIAVDCSGSIGEKELREFGGEISAIHQDTRPVRIHVVYFDSEVLRHDQFTPEDTLEITPVGGGGTAFSPIFKYAADKGIEPAACVFLTDLCCSNFGPQPNYPVLWATTMSETAPWGEVLRIKA